MGQDVLDRRLGADVGWSTIYKGTFKGWNRLIKCRMLIPLLIAASISAISTRNIVDLRFEPFTVNQPAACTASAEYPEMIGTNYIPELLGPDATFEAANSRLKELFQEFAGVAKGSCISQLGSKRYLIFTGNVKVVSFISGALTRTVRTGGTQSELLLSSTFRTRSPSSRVQFRDLLVDPQRSLLAFATRIYNDIYRGRRNNRGTIVEVLHGLSARDDSGFALTKQGIVLAFLLSGEAPGYVLIPYGFATDYLNTLGRSLVEAVMTKPTVEVNWVRVPNQVR